jgi:type I phosphodiesterase/nucleotide pyrophosphatase
MRRLSTRHVAIAPAFGLRVALAFAAGCHSKAVPREAPAPLPAPPAESAPSEPSARAAGAPGAAPAHPSAPAEPATGGAPRLVVSVIYDQLGSETLLANIDLLDTSGAIRRAIDGGVYFERGVYPYANTLTAPGHAAIHTGAPPSLSGIDGNSEWDPVRQRSVPATEDPRYPVFGREPGSAGASPARLRAPTVAQSLRAATHGAARIISLSIKERSAILSVGPAADLVLWYDASLGAFTSSSVWGAALPPWLARHQAEHPLRALLVPWEAERPDVYRRRLGPDDAPGEGVIAGFGSRFPHRVDQVENPLALLPITPRASEYLVALAEVAAREAHLGEDDVVDLLALSISGTDGAGHVFGPGSWEYLDHLIKADRAVGQWLDRLARDVPLAVLITSDHGVAPLPEAHGDGASRVVPGQIQRRLEASLVAEFGAGPWVAGMVSPFVYLTAAARQHPERARLLAVARAALLREPVLREVWPLARVRAFGDADPIERAFRISVAPDNDADLMFWTRPYCPLDLGTPADQGTNHGTPYDYDRQVPVLAWGHGVPHRRSPEPVDQLRVAATIAHLLGVPAPASALPEPLF